MKIILSLFLAILLLSTKCIGQSLEGQCQKVLALNRVNIKMKFDESTKKDGRMITELVYLGAIKTNQSKSYKLISFAYIWGANFHTSASILIYTDKNLFYGRYYLGDARDLPTKLVDRQLIFDNQDNDDCDKSIITQVDLKNGFPKEIFLRCQGKYGDIFSLTVGK